MKTRSKCCRRAVACSMRRQEKGFNLRPLLKEMLEYFKEQNVRMKLKGRPLTLAELNKRHDLWIQRQIESGLLKPDIEQAGE